MQQRRRWANRQFWFVFVLALAVIVAVPALWFRNDILNLPQLGPDNISGTQREPTGNAENDPTESGGTQQADKQETKSQTDAKPNSKPNTEPGAATLLAAEGSLAQQATQLPTGGKPSATQTKVIADLKKRIEGGVGVTHLSVLDGKTGQHLFTLQDGPVSPASLQKSMTSLYVLETLGPEHRIPTTVALSGTTSLKDVDPRLTATIIGRGDANLTDAKITDLARQTATSIAQQLEAEEVEGPVRIQVRVDDTAFTGGTLNSHWNPVLARNGNIAPLRPAALYGGREQPGTQANRSGADPTVVIGQRFHRELSKALAKTGADAAVQGLGTKLSQRSPAGAKQVAKVLSHPLAEDLKTLLRHSDNQMVETLMRAALLEQGLRADEKTAAAQLQQYVRGFATKTTAKQVELVDASGLAVQDTIPPSVLARAIATTYRAGQDPQNPRHAVARAYLDALPVGGQTGTLKDRFTGAQTAGKLTGKTGSLLHAAGLSGIVTGSSDTYIFSITVDNALGQQAQAQAKVDRIIGALFN